jgi:flagellar biosynthetic protein FliR
VPAQVRVLLSVALAALVTPTQWHVAVAWPQNIPTYAVLIGGEVIIGVCLGLGIMVLVQGMQLAGELIGQVAGIQLAELYDPAADANVPLFSRLMFLVTLAVFVAIGGHRLVMAGLLDTFQHIPPGGAGLPDAIAEAFVLLLTESFALALRAAAPVLAALVLATLVLGLIGRTVPQLNVLVVGLNLNALLTFAALALSLGGAAWAFQEQVQPALETLLDALGARPPTTDAA